MPARINKIRHDENTRAKIQSAMIINRLQGHVKGTVELGATQVSAALGLLRKTLPDLASTEVSGDGGGPLQVIVQRFTEEAK